MRVAGFAVVVLFLMEAASPAAADPVEPASAAGSSSLDRITCKSYAPPTGTRFGARRECHTQREWNNLARTSQDYLNIKQANSLEAKCLSLNACD